MPELMPTIFFGHGNPMHAVSNNGYTDGWAAIGASLPRPRAILAVSAHWYIPGCAVTAQAAPPTIHDFGGFPRALKVTAINGFKLFSGQFNGQGLRLGASCRV